MEHRARSALFTAALLAICFAATPLEAGNQPQLAGCQVFPANNIWNTAVDTLPVDHSSATWVATIGAGGVLHPDWGPSDGIAFVTVRGTQPKVAVKFDYADESDPGPYPIPPNAPIEGGANSTGDRHVLVLDTSNCLLYETWSSYPKPNGTWTAGSGAIFDLKTNDLRPAGWTSSDAAGLPVLPGLVRYDEVAAGEIRHAIRFTVPKTQKRYIWPARHYASSITDPSYPPMGARFRLKAGFDISGFSPAAQVILRALEKYGMILADNGSAWYITGAPDSHWDISALTTEMRRVHGSDFEAVDCSSLMADPNSGRAKTGTAADNIVNAASFSPGPVSAGEIVSIFGSELGPTAAATADPGSGTMPSILAETRVYFDGLPAPLLYVQDSQINLVVPYAVAGKETTVVQTEYRGVKSAAVSVQVVDSIPGIFTSGSGASPRPAVFHADWSLNSSSNPIDKGKAVVCYLTGEGQTQPAGADGKLALATYPQPLLPVSVTIGGVDAQVFYAGAAPGYVAGLMQLNAFVPSDTPSGTDVPMVIRVGAAAVQQAIALSVK